MRREAMRHTHTKRDLGRRGAHCEGDLQTVQRHQGWGAAILPIALADGYLPWATVGEADTTALLGPCPQAFGSTLNRINNGCCWPASDEWGMDVLPPSSETSKFPLLPTPCLV